MITSAPAPSAITLPSDQDASGRTLGSEEIALVGQAIATGTLTSTKGTFVSAFQKRFAHMLGLTHGYACASGTAAIHTAIAALDPEPGDEIITSPITDMGALAPIIYQAAIPMFADVDPQTYNITAASIERALSPKTKAIIVTHLFGNPCDMGPIMELANARGIPVIEDCAQAFLATSGRRYVGTIGTIGCFSLQQGKHITCGEGGIVVTADEALARRMYLFINKAWGYGDANPDHYFLALNYRMSELQGAVGLAQLEKLEQSVQQRIDLANELDRLLSDCPGVQTPAVHRDAVHTYWKYCLRVDPERIRGGAVGLAQALRQSGIFTVPRYIQKPAFMCEVFAKQRTFGNSHFPFTLARPEALDYRRERFPGTFEALDRVLVVPWNDRFTDRHVEFIAASVRDAAVRLAS
ncbi:MAG TPA: DegT/DnrJ/EryC1/StrS family aminotransferase [Candidatus Binatus sp.]|nr:DegT/DnrJ/EryC1/StrS family aminotransferase [Candidatus Binatus sp.]